MDKYTKYALKRIDELELEYKQTVEKLTKRVETLEAELEQFKGYQEVRNRATENDLMSLRYWARSY